MSRQAVFFLQVMRNKVDGWDWRRGLPSVVGLGSKGKKENYVEESCIPCKVKRGTNQCMANVHTTRTGIYTLKIRKGENQVDLAHSCLEKNS